MATLNTAEWFGLHDRGGIAPGRVADLLVIDDLRVFRPRQVYVGGRVVAENGKMLAESIPPARLIPAAVGASVNIDWSKVDFAIPARGTYLRAIGVVEGQLITTEEIVPARIVAGEAVADIDRDLLKMAVVERHQASGAMGLGFIQGMGLQRGAIAGTVAHDHHNLVIIGVDDRSMMTAARAVAAMGGGLVVTDGEQGVAALSLPVAGVMSDQPIAAVRREYDRLIQAARQQGSELHDPFMAMSFKALEVIPKLKLTDRGLVDVEQFGFVDLFVSV